MPLNDFHPVIVSWFRRRFGEPTEPQRRGWPAIRGGRHTLIASPTGSGKTLAAFLSCLDRLVRLGLSGELRDRVEVLYVSPLKALSSDVRRNLEVPLLELQEEAMRQGLLLPPIRVGLRTGDTPQAERQAMARRPPQILVTTPESLYLCLTAARPREGMRAVHTVIVDEIHALVRDKRGTHLSLSLERLDALCRSAGNPPPIRVGLSATQKPIEEVARFLVGASRIAPDGTPDCHIVDGGHLRQMDLRVLTPRDELSAVCSNAQWADVHDQLARLIAEHRSTLVFVGTRRLAERTAHHLVERLGEQVVTAHHGSMSRRMRQSVEERLKQGELKAVVATASLELGIDIGAVDLVCQLGSPRAIATLLQRVGRSNHRPEQLLLPKGRLFALTRDELVECAALYRAVGRGDFDRVIIPACPLDVLAQQLCAACAVEEWDEDALYDLCRRAYPFRDLARERFEQVLSMLSDGVATRRGRRGTHLHRDQVGRRLRGRRGARLFAIVNGGTIPEPNDYDVVTEPEGAMVGKVDEDWAIESSAGDIFLLGSTSWRIRSVRGGKVFVEDAGGAPPTVPFWFGEAPGRTFELSRAVSDLRRDIEARIEELPDGPEAVKQAAVERVVEWLAEGGGVEPQAARQVLTYLSAGRAALHRLPTQQDLVAERFFDEGGGMQLVLHMPLGARLNRAFGLALRKRFCRSFNFELQAAATDDGVLLSLGETHSFPLESVWQFLSSASVDHVLQQALLGAPLFGPHFRWTAMRALSLPRRRGGKKVPPPIARIYSDELLAAVFPSQAACPENLPGGDIDIPDHPLVGETLRECLEDVMDLPGLRRLLLDIEEGRVRVHGRDTPEPSVLSHQILNAMPYAFLDDVPLEERRSRTVAVRRGLPPDVVLQRDAGLAPEAIATVRREAWPIARDPDELHDALLQLVYLPLDFLASFGAAAETADGWVAALLAARRMSVASLGATRALVAAERAALVRRLFFGAARFEPEPPPIPWAFADEEGAEERAATEVLRGWLGSTGPWTQAGLAAALGLPPDLVETALLRLEAEGVVLRGRFTSTATAGADLEWCDRHLLARIHRLTVHRLRREIEPVSLALFVRFLGRWQHLSPGTQLAGPAGLLQVLNLLQGYEAPACAWEEDLLPRRLSGYDPAWLDELCFAGELSWGRLRPAAPDVPVRRGPTRAAPITLWLRADQGWLLQRRALPDAGAARSAVSQTAEAIAELLGRRGALFLGELCAAAGQGEREVMDALAELVSASRCTADGFAGLRALIGTARPGRSSAGRWSLLPVPVANPADSLEPWARLYLRRYGVVLRELLTREPGPAYRDVLPVLRTLEARGEIRGGRFVEGLSGEQFALPEALEALRALRRHTDRQAVIGAAPPDALLEELDVSAADPLNLPGVLLPGARVPSTAAVRVRYRDGVPIPEAGQEKLTERFQPHPRTQVDISI